jgi:PIN domain nuclease of toxin-antitoxin system
MENIIYLDTHVIIWLFSLRTDLLSNLAKTEIENNNLYISPIVELELQYLLETNRINESPEIIVKRLMQNIGLQICEQEFSSIIKKALSYSWTRDSFDRIITAQAAITQSKLLTKDDSILSNYKFAFWN